MNDVQVQTPSVASGTAPAVSEAPKPAAVPADNVSREKHLRNVPLSYPFKAGDKTLTEVVFPRRPKAGDLIQGHGASTPAEQELYQIAALIGVNAEDLKEMDGQDYMAVQREWAAFLGVR
jgi:hypothetical protein